MKNEMKEVRSQKLEVRTEGFSTVFGYLDSRWILELGIWNF
jgi:hypothetical protein